MRFIPLLLLACRPAGDVTVFAASSLREVAEDLAREWTARTGRTVRVQTGASSTLARQIREGARADLFLSADDEWAAGVAPLGRRAWLGNRLAVVGNPDLARASSLALGGESVPVGRYARAALARRGIPLPARVISGASARDVLAKVAEGAAESGIVYETDARIAGMAAVPLDEVVHVAALLTEEGRALYDAVREPWVRALVEARGYRWIP
jgi:molybdate transport system substrate-binding protein